MNKASRRILLSPYRNMAREDLRKKTNRYYSKTIKTKDKALLGEKIDMLQQLLGVIERSIDPPEPKQETDSK